MLVIGLLAVLAWPGYSKPTVVEDAKAISIIGKSFKLVLERDRGVFDMLVRLPGSGEWRSVMRPKGEFGWFGYNTDSGQLPSTSAVKPVLAIQPWPEGVLVTSRCQLDEATGGRHLAQFYCLDEGVIIQSMYGANGWPGKAVLVRLGPKLDVDVDFLSHYSCTGDARLRYEGTLPDKQREFYVGARAWGGPERFGEFSRSEPWLMLDDPESGAAFAVAYPFQRDLWFGKTRQLQLYTDGGNYWYTGCGSVQDFGKDYLVALWAGDARAADINQQLSGLVSKTEALVASGKVISNVKPLPDPASGPLYLISYDHAVGYPKIQKEARRSVEDLESHPELRIGLQAEGYTLDWLEQNDPTFMDEARGWLQKYQGRWVPGGGSYGQPYFTFISEESGIRQLFYGTRSIKEHFGYDNTIYMYSEHETMPQLPQVLAGMGYEGAIFRTHMTYGGDGPYKDADLVNWTGPDGSRILSVPAYTVRQNDGLGNEWLIINYEPGIEWNTGAASTWKEVEHWKSEVLARGISHPVISRCEDWYTRPSEQLLKDAAGHSSQGTEWVTNEDYFAILTEAGIEPVDWQVGPNDFSTQQPWGYTGNRTWTNPRVASSKALTAEALAVGAIRSGFQWTAEHQQRLDEAWKQLLIAEHHDTLICAIYDEGRDFTVPSEQLSGALAKEVATYLAQQTEAKGPSVFVFNPTAQPRTEKVALSDGRILVAKDVPALGYKVFSTEEALQPAASQSDQLKLETDRYTVEWAPTGGLTRLFDKQLGKELIAPGVRTGTLSGVIDSDWAYSQGSAQLTAAGSDYWEVVEQGRVGVVGYKLTYHFTEGDPKIGLTVSLDVPRGTRIGCPDKGETPQERRSYRAHKHDEKLRYSLATTLADPKYAGDYVWGRSYPTKVRHLPLIISELPAKTVDIDANMWAGLEQDNLGLAIANRGSSGYRAVGGTLELLLAYSGEYVWGDNFLTGAWDQEFALIPYAGKTDRPWVQQQAQAFYAPLYAIEFTGTGGSAPMQGSFVDLEQAGAETQVLALFPQEGKLWLRLVNMSPAKVSATCREVTAASNLALTESLESGSKLNLMPWRAQTYELKR